MVRDAARTIDYHCGPDHTLADPAVAGGNNLPDARVN
jgi:hypothetical protein